MLANILFKDALPATSIVLDRVLFTICGDSSTDTIMSTPQAAHTPLVPAPALFSVKGKHALITGGSRGIGQAMAHALADAGASICLAQRDLTNTTTAAALRAKGIRVELVQCDLTCMQDAKEVVPKAVELMNGRIDIVVNCGGLLKRKPSTEVSEDDWDSVSTETFIECC